MLYPGRVKFERPENTSIYIGIRFIPVLLGLAFSLSYSRLMGIEIRSTLSFVLLANTLISLLFMSGLCLHIRKSKPAEKNRGFVQGYLLLTFILTLFSSGTMFGVLVLYNNFFGGDQSNPLPSNAITAIMLYSIISNLNLPITELLATLQSLRALVFTEIAVVLMQIFIFLVLVAVGETTYFVSALLAYSLSYSFAIFGSLIILVHLGCFSLQPFSSIRSILNMELLRNYNFSFLFNLIERLDKVIFGFFYSTPQLAQVSTFASLLAVFRVVPDTRIRVRHHRRFMLSNMLLWQKGARNFRLSALSLILLSILCNFLIYVVLGPSWLLPLPVIFALTLYEFFVWKSKVSLEELMEQQDRKKAFKLKIGLGAFFLILLPVLMINLSYELALSVSVLFLALWFKLARPSRQSLGL